MSKSITSFGQLITERQEIIQAMNQNFCTKSQKFQDGLKRLKQIREEMLKLSN
jgi:predicted transcriptional regulator